VCIKRIITDNGKEYTFHKDSNIAKHRYEAFLKSTKIVHSLIKISFPEGSGYVEKFHRTLLYEFLLIAIKKNVYSSLVQLQDDIYKFMV